MGGSNDKRLVMVRALKEILWVLGCLCSSVMCCQRFISPFLGIGHCQSQVLAQEKDAKEHVEAFADGG